MFADSFGPSMAVLVVAKAGGRACAPGSGAVCRGRQVESRAGAGLSARHIPDAHSARAVHAQCRGHVGRFRLVGQSWWPTCLRIASFSLHNIHCRALTIHISRARCGPDATVRTLCPLLCGPAHRRLSCQRSSFTGTQPTCTMAPTPIDQARWRTSSFASPPDTSPAELAELGDHLRRCQQRRGTWFRAGNAANRLNGFLAPRFVSTLALVAMLSVGACMAL